LALSGSVGSFLLNDLFNGIFNHVETLRRPGFL
jgi:hypothetical protein